MRVAAWVLMCGLAGSGCDLLRETGGGGGGESGAFARFCECASQEWGLDEGDCLAELPDSCEGEPECEAAVECINAAGDCFDVLDCVGGAEPVPG